MLKIKDKFGFLDVNSNFDTHRPFLFLGLSITDGDILELGMGNGSTIPLAKYCEANNRKLDSYENNKEWYEKFTHLQSKNVSINFIENWDNLPIKKYSMIFVDHAPGDRRIKEIARLRDYCDLMVIHDTEPLAYTGYNFDKIWPLFKYKIDYVTNGAWATIVSNKLFDND